MRKSYPERQAIFRVRMRTKMRKSKRDRVEKEIERQRGNTRSEKERGEI